MEVSSILSAWAKEKELRECPYHGQFLAINVRGKFSPCPVCFKNLLSVEDMEASRSIHQQQEEIRSKRMIDESNIPSRFLDRNLSNFIAENEGQQTALDECQSYAAHFDEMRNIGRSLIFVGKPGTGKTHLAVGIAHEIMNQGYTALYSSVLRALRSVKDGFSTTGESETAVVKRLAVPDLLILDEAGITYETDAEAMILYEIVNQRYEEKKPTLFTSNYTLIELKTVMGERVIDRLREGEGRLVHFDWESWRTRRYS